MTKNIPPDQTAWFTPLPEPNRWRWKYSRWFGVMYGPIPVGIVVGVPILIWLRAR